MSTQIPGIEHMSVISQDWLCLLHAVDETAIGGYIPGLAVFTTCSG